MTFAPIPDYDRRDSMNEQFCDADLTNTRKRIPDDDDLFLFVVTVLNGLRQRCF